jgi:hypothetical protein
VTSLHRLNRRLYCLDRAAEGRMIVVWQGHDEAEEAAIDRWCAAHSGEPRPNTSN